MSSSPVYSQPFSEAAFEAVHFSMVGFVVESRQMNHAVKNQDAHFQGQGPREAARISTRGFRRDGNVANVCVAMLGLCPIGRKRKHIGGPSLFAKYFVEMGHVFVTDQLDGHGFRGETEFAADAFVELLQGLDGHGHAALAIDDHWNLGNVFNGPVL
jgi:hypothetical protein